MLVGSEMYRALLVLCLVLGSYGRSIDQLNDRPIIGILTQESKSSKRRNGLNSSDSSTYIAASYVKFVESGGARVLPIWVGKDRSYYEDIMSKINGVLFPGGSAWFTDPNGYADAGEHIFSIAKTMNDDSNYFPLWGTCLGFELLTFLSANRKEHRIDCSSEKQSIPLNFKEDFRSSRLFANTPFHIVKILGEEAVTANYHVYCVTEKNMTDYGLNDFWKVLSVNDDFNGLNFISIIEAKSYPFYGVQFHPEKNTYEWVENRNIPHTSNAIEASGYFAKFLVDEARKNLQEFTDREEEAKSLIYNYPSSYTGLEGSVFIQKYVFN